jgi:hypothetical protein
VESGVQDAVSDERIERHIHNASLTSPAPSPRLDFGVSPNCASRGAMIRMPMQSAWFRRDMQGM